MRTLPLVLLAVASLLLPTAALAGGSAAPASRTFVIHGLLLGDQKADVMGKLGIDGSQLYASVGCNTIGGKVSLDGDTLTITDPLAMTEMACPGTDGDLEAMLIKVLDHGPFRISSSAWIGNGASLLVEELASGPGPNASAPDDPVSSSPGAVIIDPFASCPPLPSGVNGSTPVDGGPGSVGGSGGSSGSGSTGGGTVTGPTEPDAGSGSGGGTTGSGDAPAATVIDLPAASSDQPPSPPDPGATSGTVDPYPGFTGTGSDPGIGTDPGIGKPIITDPCPDRMYAVDQANGAGAVPPKAVDASAEHSAATSSASTLVLPVGAALLGLLVIGVLVGRRPRSATPR